MTYSIFGWTNLLAAFRWSNGRAAFVGSLRDRDHAEMRARYVRVSQAHQQSRYADPDAALDFTSDVVDIACRRAGVNPCESLADALREMVWQLLHADPVFFWMPEASAFDDPSLNEGIALRKFLAAKERVLARSDWYENLWRETIIQLIIEFLGDLPGAAFDSGADDRNAPFAVMLIDLCARPAQIVEGMMATVYDEDVTRAELFNKVREQFEHNMAAAMGMTPERARESGRMAPLPTQMNGTPPRDVASLFLGRTPFDALLRTEIPFALPVSARFEHMHILAGSGHGKTQTLQHLILSDLRRPDPPSMVIIDSQGDMLQKLSRLELFEDLGDRLIIIDPRDVDHPPALNMFDVNIERISHYDTADREQILNGVVELYEYFFGSLLGAELTQKQALVFRYLARLMIQIPSANLRTMIELMDDITPYQKIIDRLPESSRMFFEREFTDRQFGETRTQVKRRLYGIIENQTFERMFSAPRNRIDLPTALNEGKIVLVNTAKDFLKSNSSILGRYFIALTLQAALERAPIPESERRPTFLYIDEASEYFDSNIDNLLIQARKYKLGIVIAHQYLDQLQGGLRSSIAANTSIKLAGGVSDRDAHAIASDMRTTPSFILDQRRMQEETHFACYLRNTTATAVALAVPLGVLENQPQMSPIAYRALLAENRKRVSGPMLAAPVPAASEAESVAAAESDGLPPPAPPAPPPETPPAETRPAATAAGKRQPPEPPRKPLRATRAIPPRPPKDGPTTEASPEW